MLVPLPFNSEEELVLGVIRPSLTMAWMDARRRHENAKALWLGVEESERLAIEKWTPPLKPKLTQLDKEQATPPVVWSCFPLRPTAPAPRATPMTLRMVTPTVTSTATTAAQEVTKGRAR